MQRLFAVLLGCSLTVPAALVLAAVPVKPNLSHRPALFKDARQALAIARAQGRHDVVLIIVAERGAAGEVARKAEQLGGNVRFRADDVDYLRVRIPIDKATELAEFGRVEAASVDVDDNAPIRLTASGEDTKTSGGAASDASQAWPPTISDYPLRHPYSPLGDLNARDLRAAHPTWDGRGATIAVLDGNFDMLLPEFQTAYSLDGRKIPKVADYLTSTDPRDEADLVPQWVSMQATVTSNDRHVTFQGKTFTVPRDGTYRIGFFDERRFNSPANAAYIDQDVDRNGNPKGDDGLFGVLWNEKSNDVWVDTNRDLDFSTETALTDYSKRPVFGVFGKDDPATPVRDSVGFAVQTDAKNKFVAIEVGVYQHASIIMGAVVGNREPHGILEGVAPGARLLSMYWGSSMHGMAEGLIKAFRHPAVDLIVLEQSVALLSISYTLTDGHHPISLLIQRLIDKYDKLIFVPGDNAPAFAFVAEDGVAPGAVSVGGYQSAESYRLNAGFVPENYDNLHFGALSHGPSTAGALKPDLLAPSGQMSTDPGYRKGASIKGLFQLPPGYEIGSGTSTATPTAAGAAALVVSAAKQTGIRYSAVTLKAALTGSARRIPRLAAHEQGNGLIQVAKAIDLLGELQKTKPISITVRAPVTNVLSELFVTPNEGEGIYEREGWKVGDKRERLIGLTRTSGPSAPMTFDLSWDGNDGTFASPTSVTLPLNKKVTVPVTLSAQKEGAHSATLTLTSTAIPGPVKRILNTLVVPHQLNAANGYALKTEVTPPLPGDTSVFIAVPADTAALTVKAASADVRISLIGPDRSMRWLASCNPPEGEMPTCSFAGPMPGVWEINVNSIGGRQFDPGAPSPLKSKPVAITASLVGMDISASAASLAGTGGAASPFTLTVKNRLGAVTAEAGSFSLGSAFEKRTTIAQGEQQMYEIDVPEGATSLRARIGDLGDARADLDVYLFDCSAPDAPAEKAPTAEQEKGNKAPARPDAPCGPRAKRDDRDGNGEVEVAYPHAGRWVVVVDAYRVPSGSTSYRYADVFSHPRLGSITVADVPGERAPNATWTVKGNLWIAERPQAPRKLLARLPVRSGAIVQPVRVAEGFDASGIIDWYVPLGSTDLLIE